MKEDIPEIELFLTSSVVNPNRRTLKGEWTMVESEWMMMINGIHQYAHWLHKTTGERIEVDYDLACDYMIGYPEAYDELEKLLPERE